MSHRKNLQSIIWIFWANFIWWSTLVAYHGVNALLCLCVMLCLVLYGYVWMHCWTCSTFVATLIELTVSDNIIIWSVVIIANILVICYRYAINHSQCVKRIVTSHERNTNSTTLTIRILNNKAGIDEVLCNNQCLWTLLLERRNENYYEVWIDSNS